MRLILRSGEWLQTRDATTLSALQIAQRESERFGFVATMPKLMQTLADG